MQLDMLTKVRATCIFHVKRNLGQMDDYEWALGLQVAHSAIMAPASYLYCLIPGTELFLGCVFFTT